MSKCRFRYIGNFACDEPTAVKEVDKTTTILHWKKKGEGVGNIAVHPVLKYEEFCCYHRKLMAGRIMWVDGSNIPAATKKVILKKKEMFLVEEIVRNNQRRLKDETH